MLTGSDGEPSASSTKLPRRGIVRTRPAATSWAIARSTVDEFEPSSVASARHDGSFDPGG